MKKTNCLEFSEFYILGCSLFIAIFILFCMRESILVGHLKMCNTCVSRPTKYFHKINQNISPVSELPEMTIVDDSGTCFNLKDDIVTYNTSFYSITLPYDLNYYTEKFGANNSSKQLIKAQEQLYNQVYQNELISEYSKLKQYEDMFNSLNKLVAFEDRVYDYINSVNNYSNATIEKDVLEKINSLNSKSNPMFVIIMRNQAEVIDGLKKQDIPAAYEATVIIKNLNNQIILLARKTYSDYYLKVFDRGADYDKLNKPAIINIIEKIDEELGFYPK